MKKPRTARLSRAEPWQPKDRMSQVATSHGWRVQLGLAKLNRGNRGTGCPRLRQAMDGGFSLP